MEFNKRLPIFEQIVEKIEEKIVSGEFQPNQVLPSRRELAQLWQVNPNTVQRAYKELEELGLIYTDGNIQSCVTADNQRIDRLRESLLQNALQQLVRTLEPLNMSPEEVIDNLKRIYTERRDADVKN